MSESDSRKEMVGQLLKDVVEAADRPQLNANANAQFDRCDRLLWIYISMTKIDSEHFETSKHFGFCPSSLIVHVLPNSNNPLSYVIEDCHCF